MQQKPMNKPEKQSVDHRRVGDRRLRMARRNMGVKAGGGSTEDLSTVPRTIRLQAITALGNNKGEKQRRRTTTQKWD